MVALVVARHGLSVLQPVHLVDRARRVLVTADVLGHDRPLPVERGSSFEETDSGTPRGAALRSLAPPRRGQPSGRADAASSAILVRSEASALPLPTMVKIAAMPNTRCPPSGLNRPAACVVVSQN